MSELPYPPLKGPDSIRVLRLLPDPDKNAPIKCHLFEYNLVENGKRTHQYEALSYTWGSMVMSDSIVINDYSFPVTENLHAALSRLRDHYFERIIWIDAICINQKSNADKESQIQLMGKIYGHALRVVVWLGEEADDSNEAFERIRALAEDQSRKGESAKDQFIRESMLQGGYFGSFSPYGREEEYKSMQRRFMGLSTEEAKRPEIQALLRRPWFRRMWVLQEVGLARDIVIMCGSMEMNGYTFSTGVNRLDLFEDAYQGSQGLLWAIAYLIQGAVFRSVYGAESKLSMGELIDMYHSHEATMRHDKVYALLGMTSDDADSAGLLPDYKISWEVLLERLIRHIIHREITVQMCGDREMALIYGKGYILGSVRSVESDNSRQDRQHVTIIPHHAPWDVSDRDKLTTRWTLRTLAKPIRQDDIICLLEGASCPTIIRAQKDHFAVIMLKVTALQSLTNRDHQPPHELLLLWNWESAKDEQEDGSLSQVSDIIPEPYKIELPKRSPFYMTHLLAQAELYQEALECFQLELASYETAGDADPPEKLAAMEEIAMIRQKDDRPWQAREIYERVLEARKQAQGANHSDTLNTLASLAFTYVRQVSTMKNHSATIRELLRTIRQYQSISEGQMIELMNADCGEKLLIFLFDHYDLPTSEAVVKAAAQNGADMMQLLFDRRGDTLLISEEVLIAAAGNWYNGLDIMGLLFRERGSELLITEKVVQAAAGNGNGYEIVKLLFDERGNDLPITEAVVVETAGNEDQGPEIMKLLLDQLGDMLPITENVVIEAVENFKGSEIMKILLEGRGDAVPISEHVVRSLFRQLSWDILELLLVQRGSGLSIPLDLLPGILGDAGSREFINTLFDIQGADIHVSKELIMAAAARPNGDMALEVILKKGGNNPAISEKIVIAAIESPNGYEKLKMLLEFKGDELPITEAVVKQAVMNKEGHEIMQLLVERKGNALAISEEVFQAAGRNYLQGDAIKALLRAYSKKE